MATIALERVSKVYGNDFLAVDDVSLEIADGEFIVLVGPSGCGKSTLLRMIAGLEDVTAGTISIDGVDVTDLAPRHRDIAMVFQSYALYPHMTVRQNLGYGLKVRKAPKAEAQRRIDEVADLLGLTEMLDRRPAQLSGGQRQRVAMGRAIVREPRAFLMDEPLSNLDAKLRVGMRASLAELHARLGVTTVYVTHDQTEAMTLGQRVAVMRDGRLLQVDRPQHLYARPRDVFVAAFIGSPSMNLVEARDRGRRRALRASSACRSTRNRARRGRGPGRARHPAGGLRGRRPSRAAHLPPIAVQVDVRRGARRPTRTCSSRSTRRRSTSRRRGGGRRGDAPRADEHALHARDSTRRPARARATPLELAVDPARFHFFDLETAALPRRRSRARRRGRRRRALD